MISRIVALGLVLAFVSETAAAVVRSGWPVMGTVLQVTVVSTEPNVARELAEEAIAEARRWDDVLTTWRSEGELARLNRGAGTGWMPVSIELAAALGRMEELSRATDGAFDPGVGPLVDLWRTGREPPDAAIAAGPWRIADALVLEGGRAALARGAAIDAAGIGKGLALDSIVARLRRRGASAAWLDFGGSSQTGFGAAPEGDGEWWIAVAGPGAGDVLGVMKVRDASVSTSRATGMGVPEGPIVDPRTRLPVEAPRLATVVASDAATAEAWSTALVVLGRRGLSQARAHGVEALVSDRTGVYRTADFPLETGPAATPQRR